ncbi:GTP cyclohydrolase 1 type 2/Nif3 [Hypoxylon rubiginosum]|uniref:GTP cyclohydrolase 1 type 2/Nif3 n=1 Tax=Hypoxylon rubiginosum TaxID=110542 RepID=A0ACB9Z4Z5_9PEZI|nr:GTP cyclohydrolase 1 type 2/Nif3 [Hypoxylon rubiginosum]
MAGLGSASPRFKLVFRVPPSALAACKSAIFAAGAGRYPGPGNYTECCWTTMGTGQFRPGDAANPHIGKVGELEEVPEARVETLCVGESVVRKAVEALKKAHPYEEPGYEVFRLEDI